MMFGERSVAGNRLPAIVLARKSLHRSGTALHNLDEPLKTFLITSPGAHEGKSTVLLNLGRAFLETDRHLLMIDADLRRPSLHRALRTPNEVGLADVLRAGSVWPEAFRALAPGMDFMPSGIRPANPSSLIASKHMVRVLELARERANVVLIDAPPVLAVADCLPLCRYVDGVILVARFGITAAPLLAPPPYFRLTPARFWKHRTGGLLQLPSGDPELDTRWTMLAAED